MISHGHFALLLLLAIGCQPTPPANVPAPAVSPATRPATAASPQTFEDRAAGIRFSYPAGWTAEPTTGTTVLRAVAPPRNGSAVLTLDVPNLPPHIPGLIPVGLVASGYVDDVKKRMPDGAGPPPAEVNVADAAARRVALAGHDASGHATTDDAVLIVHGDRVYVLSADADPAGRHAAVAALNAAVASIIWTH